MSFLNFYNAVKNNSLADLKPSEIADLSYKNKLLILELILQKSSNENDLTFIYTHLLEIFLSLETTDFIEIILKADGEFIFMFFLYYRNSNRKIFLNTLLTNVHYGDFLSVEILCGFVARNNQIDDDLFTEINKIFIDLFINKENGVVCNFYMYMHLFYKDVSLTSRDLEFINNFKDRIRVDAEITRKFLETFQLNLVIENVDEENVMNYLFDKPENEFIWEKIRKFYREYK